MGGGGICSTSSPCPPANCQPATLQAFLASLTLEGDNVPQRKEIIVAGGKFFFCVCLCLFFSFALPGLLWSINIVQSVKRRLSAQGAAIEGASSHSFVSPPQLQFIRLNYFYWLSNIATISVLFRRRESSADVAISRLWLPANAPPVEHATNSTRIRSSCLPGFFCPSPGLPLDSKEPWPRNLPGPARAVPQRRTT